MLQKQNNPILNPGSGGVNEKVAGHLVGDNQAAPPDSSTLALKNCHTDTIGSIVKRKGYTVYGGAYTNVDQVTGLTQYEKFNGNTFEILCGDDDATEKIYDISTPASPVDITGSATITSDSNWDFANVADTLVMTNEARDTPLKWTGSSNVASLGGTPPSGKYCEEFQNYCFIANTSSNPERVYWSGLFDPESWTTGSDFKRLENACTAMVKRDSVLFLFTLNSITIVTYTDDPVTPFNFDRLDTNVGCVSNRTVVNIEGVIYWLSRDGHIYRMSGFKPERVTEAIPNTIASLTASALTNACAINHRQLRQYWCCVRRGTSTTNNFVVVVDYLNNEIFFYDGMEINSIANFKDSSGEVKTYFGDRNGKAYITNNGNSDNPNSVETGIDFYRYSKMFNLSEPNKEKRFRNIKLTVNNEGDFTSEVSVTGDFGATGGQALTLSHNGGEDLLGSTFTLGTSELGKKEDLPTRNDIALNARYIQIKVTNDQADQPVIVRDMSFEYQTYQRNA